MALTKVVKHLSSTPSIVDGGNATAITIDSSENVTLSGHLNLGDNDYIKLGDSSDLLITHDGSGSWIIDNGTGGLVLASNSLSIKNAAYNEQMITAYENGAVELYHDNNKKLETTSSGVTVTGTITGTLASTATGTTQSAGTNNTTIATTAYTDAAITALVGGAPSTLDTLNEIAASINDDANYVGTVNNLIAAKAPLDSPVFSSTYTGGQDESLAEFRRDGGAVAAKIIYADATTDMEFGTTTAHAISLITGDTRRIKIDNAGNVNIGALAIASATTAPLMVAKASTDVQAIFGDNNSSIDDPSIRIIGRNTANNAIRYTFLGLDADDNHGYIGYNEGSGGFVNALNFISTGRVGIGITDPDAPLHIEDSTSSAYGGLRVVGAGTGSGSTNVRQIADFGRTNSGSVSGVWLGGRTDETTAVIGAKTASGNIAFEVYNSGWQERMRITNAGRVGIGNSSPNGTLHIGTGTNSAVTVGSQSTPAFQIGGTNNYRLGMYTDNETGYIENKNGDDGIAFRVKTAGEAMRIDGGTGKVGIGTASPSSALHIQTNDSTTNSAVNSLMITNLSTGTTTVGFGGEIRFQAERNNGVNQNTGGIRSVAEVNSGSNISSGMAFDTSTAGVNSQKLRISYDGKVAIGVNVTPNTNGQLLVGNSVSGKYVHLDDGTNVMWNISANSTTSGIIQTQGTGWSSWKPMELRANYFEFKPNNSLAATLNSTGLTLTGKVTAGATDSQFHNRLFIKNGSDGLYMGQWDGSNHRIEADASRPLTIQAYNSNGIYFGLAGNNKVQIVGAQLKLSTDVDLVQTVSSGGGDYHHITHSGNEAWSWGARSGSGSDDYLDVGISGGTKAMSWHENGKVMVGPSTTATSGAKLEVRGFNETEDATDADDATGAEEPILMLRGACGGSVQEWIHSTKATAPSGGTQTAMTSWYRFDMPGGWSGTGTPGFLEIHNQMSGMHASGSACEKFYLSLPNEHGSISTAGGLQNTSISRYYSYTANVGAYTTSLSTSFYYGNSSSFGYAAGAIFMKVVHASREPIFTMYAKYIGGTGASRNYPQKLHFLGTESTNNHQPSNISTLSVHDGRGML